MKTKFLFFLILNSFVSMLLHSQDKTSPLYVSPDFEKFDFNRLDRIRYKDTNRGSEILADSTMIYMEKGKKKCVIQETPVHQYFFTHKDFYTNGQIKAKGLAFIYKGFESGIWYFYDKKGRLKERINYDEPFTFTFDQMLKFAEKEDVIFYKYPDNQTKTRGYTRPRLTRGYDEKTGKCWWKLAKSVDEPLGSDTSYRIVTITVDGKTGEEISREYEDAKLITILE